MRGQCEKCESKATHVYSDFDKHYAVCEACYNRLCGCCKSVERIEDLCESCYKDYEDWVATRAEVEEYSKEVALQLLEEEYWRRHG